MLILLIMEFELFFIFNSFLWWILVTQTSHPRCHLPYSILTTEIYFVLKNVSSHHKIWDASSWELILSLSIPWLLQLIITQILAFSGYKSWCGWGNWVCSLLYCHWLLHAALINLGDYFDLSIAVSCMCVYMLFGKINYSGIHFPHSPSWNFHSWDGFLPLYWGDGIIPVSCEKVKGWMRP